MDAEMSSLRIRPSGSCLEVKRNAESAESESAQPAPTSRTASGAKVLAEFVWFRLCEPVTMIGYFTNPVLNFSSF